jgi:hypothetical protein
MPIDRRSDVHIRIHVGDSDANANAAAYAVGHFDLIEIARRVVIDRGPQQGAEIAAVGGRRARLKRGQLLIGSGREVGVEAFLQHFPAGGSRKVEVIIGHAKRKGSTARPLIGPWSSFRAGIRVTQSSKQQNRDRQGAFFERLG